MAKILEIHNSNMSPANDMQLSLGRYGCAWNELYVAGTSYLWNLYLEGFLDLQDNNIYSLKTLYGISSNNYIDMATDGRIILTAIAAGTPYSTPDITLSGTVYVDDNIGIYSSKQLYFRDDMISLASFDDGHLDLNADISIDLNANVSLGAYNLTTTGQISARGYKYNVVSKTADYEPTMSDDIILCDASSSSITITLPNASSSVNKILIIKALTIGGGKSILIDTPSGVYIDGSSDRLITTSYTVVRLVAYGNAWYII